MGRFTSGKMNVFDGEHFESEAFDEMEFEGTPETFTVLVPTDMVNLSRIPDEYDYDMETSHNTFFWDELLPTLIVYCLTFVLGLVGNVLIIFTIFRYRKMKSTTNVFLASLASSDLLLILFCIPVKGLEKPAAWSQMHIKNRGITTCGYSFHKPNIFTKYDTERLKLIHRLDCEFTNPFSGKSSSPMEQYWKKSPVESSVQDETEMDKLSVMEMSVLDSNVSSHIQGLKYKLPKEMNQHSEFIKNLSGTRKESLEDFKMVKSSNSDSQVIKWNAEYNKTSDHPTDLVLVYPFWKKLSRLEKAIKYKSAHHKHSSQKSRKCKKNSHETSIKFTPRKCLESTEQPTDFSTSDNSCEPRSKQKDYCRTGHKMKTADGFCCEECICLRRRVNCLEKEVEKIRKRISCIDSQTSAEEICKTPETNIKSKAECKYHKHSSQHRQEEKLTHPYHHHHYHQQENEREKVACYPNKTPSFETIVHNSKNRDLRLKSSNSDCHLNVGMEIKMENVDPVTGKKLKGEVRKQFQQDGNIQCRLFEEGQSPILVLDTDFQYNPQTGMLFKNQKSPIATNHSANIVIPLKASKERKTLSIREFSKPQNSQQTLPCAQKISEKAEEKKADSRKCMSLEQNQLDRVDQYPHHKSKKSQSLEISNNNSLEKKLCLMEKELKMDLSLEEKESKTSTTLKDKLSESELQQRSRSSSARSKSCRKPKSGKSLIPTRRRPTPSFLGRPTSGTSSLSLAFSTKSSIPESFSRTSSKQSLAKLFSFTWTFGFFLCKLVHYMQSVSAICSVLTLTAMSLERYYAIVHPMKAQYICTISQARRIITGTWVSAFLLAVPILFAQVHLRVGVKVEAYWCVRDWDNKIVWRAHELYMFLLILIVPTGVMAVAYTAICWEIWEVMQRRQDMTSGKEQGFCKKPVRNSSTESFPSFIYNNNSSKLGNKRRGRALLKKELTDDTSSVKQVIKMLVAVIVIYVLCWGPMLIDNVLQAYGVLSHIRMGWLKYMGTAFHLMAYFNSCINPIIYGFMSKNFRDSFRKTLCCMGRKQKMALRSFSLSQTRNTSIRYAESSFGRTVSIALPV